MRFSAAARITARPTAVEPVNSRWSNGSDENARRDVGIAVDHAHLVVRERLADEPLEERSESPASSSDGLIITRLPAASARDERSGAS